LKILSEDISISILLFNSNETIAQIASSLLNIDHIPLIREALLTSAHQNIILTSLIDSILRKGEIILILQKDEKLYHLFKRYTHQIIFLEIILNDYNPVEWERAECFFFSCYIQSHFFVGRFATS
jgi:hypothetical protein